MQPPMSDHMYLSKHTHTHTHTNTQCEVFKKTVGPGPAHAIDPTVTHRGKDGTPHYSLSSRHKELTPFNTPGPGTYGPEKKATCFQGETYPPAYSMGRRTKYKRRKHHINLQIALLSHITQKGFGQLSCHIECPQDY